MAGVTPENEKEKSGKPGFFSGLRKSILNTLSPNQFNKSQKENHKRKTKKIVSRTKIASQKKTRMVNQKKKIRMK